MRRLFTYLLYLGLACVLIVGIAFWWMSARQETARLDDSARRAAPGRFLQMDDGIVHYKLDGPDSARLIVLIHGGGTTGIEVWKNNVPFLLANGYRVLQYDLFGRGYSDRPAVKYDLSLFGRQLDALLDSIRAPGEFDIVAMSMGAAIGLDFAGRHPGRIGRIALLAPAISGDLKPSRLLSVPLLDRLLMTMYWYPRSVENQRKEFVNQPEFEKYATRLRYFMNFKGYKDITLSSWRHMMSVDQLRLLDKVPEGKLLLIYGLQDVYFPHENVARYQRHYPGLVVREVDQAGHMPHYEQPALVNPMIVQYLRSGNLN